MVSPAVPAPEDGHGGPVGDRGTQRAVHTNCRRLDHHRCFVAECVGDGVELALVRDELVAPTPTS